MSAAGGFGYASMRAYNGRHLTRLFGTKSNCELCHSETATRILSTRTDRCTFRFCRRFMSHARVRLTSIRPVCL